MNEERYQAGFEAGVQATIQAFLQSQAVQNENPSGSNHGRRQTKHEDDSE